MNTEGRKTHSRVNETGVSQPAAAAARFIVWPVTVVILVISGLVLAGWAFDIAQLKSIHSNWNSMKIVTAVCLALSGVALAFMLRAASQKRARNTVYATSILAGTLGLATLLTYLDELVRGHDIALAGTPFLEWFLGPADRMAIITAIGFIMLSAALLLLTSRSVKAADIAHALTLPVATLCYLTLIGYVFDVEALHNWMGVAVALHTAIALLLLSLGILIVRMDTWLMRVFAAREAGGMMARRMLLPLLIVPAVAGWVRYQGELLGYYPLPLGVALMVILNTLILLGLVWLSARSVNRVDSRRRESEERYHALVELSPSAVFVNRNNRVEFANPAALRLFGADRAEQVLGRPPFDFFPTNYHETMRARIHTLLEGSPVPVIETQVVQPDGSRRDVEVIAARVDDQRGPAIQVILRDITERKRAEGALQRQAALIDLSPDGIIVRRLDGTINFWSEGAARLYGWIKQEAVGQRTHDLLQTEFPKPLDEILREVVTAGRWSGELVQYTRGGRKIVTQSWWLAQVDERGELYELLESNVDITLRKQEEERLRRTTEELIRSNRDLEQFAYVSSHDLQEPLRMVVGFMQLLQKKYQGRLDATAEQYIHFATDGAARMQKLIEDLLAYSRVGSKAREPEPADAEELLNKALANLSASILESRAEIERSPLPTIRADGPQMIQLFQNLVGNAIKFRGDRPPVIRIGARREGGFWIFSISDNGIGIAPEFHDKVFMIFQRLHARDKYPGTGIGLAICKKIVDRQGGRIWVESEVGGGSTFYFSIPA